ncbi:hypothetical protein E2C01_050986 [Portunus trituberculatus]|uniref:Uncharacterized protein n=1 Tax=Portunus trituberculatus TaxID=210409 RepID=A0A5B7GIZ6_PORTR|nr:hypothetical protein [Portunus trituberculatus]
MVSATIKGYSGRPSPERGVFWPAEATCYHDLHTVSQPQTLHFQLLISGSIHSLVSYRHSSARAPLHVTMYSISTATRSLLALVDMPENPHYSVTDIQESTKKQRALSYATRWLILGPAELYREQLRRAGCVYALVS